MERKKINIGDKAMMKARATESVIEKIAEVSGDYNPVHIDDNYAKNTIFGKRIAHGLFCQGLVSNLIGNQLPGHGSIFVKETVRYLQPVYVDEEICCKAEIINIDASGKIEIKFECQNENESVVLDGTAVVKFL